MADDALRRFYDRVAGMVEHINEYRIAHGNADKVRIEQVAARFSILVTPLLPAVSAALDYEKKREVWKCELGVWKHSGQIGESPAPLAWPNSIPRHGKAMYCAMALARVQAAIDGRYSVETSLIWVLEALDELKDMIESPEDDTSNGTITRGQLARVLGISTKTLANRASELPPPLGRDNKNAPIYNYESAAESAKRMYPDRAFLFKKFDEMQLDD